MLLVSAERLLEVNLHLSAFTHSLAKAAIKLCGIGFQPVTPPYFPGTLNSSQARSLCHKNKKASKRYDTSISRLSYGSGGGGDRTPVPRHFRQRVYMCSR